LPTRRDDVIRPFRQQVARARPNLEPNSRSLNKPELFLLRYYVV